VAVLEYSYGGYCQKNLIHCALQWEKVVLKFLTIYNKFMNNLLFFKVGH